MCCCFFFISLHLFVCINDIAPSYLAAFFVDAAIVAVVVGDAAIVATPSVSSDKYYRSLTIIERPTGNKRIIYKQIE